MMTLDQQLEMAATFARAFFNGHKSLMPMIHAIDKDGNHHVIGVPQIGGTDREKNHIAVEVRKTLKELGAQQYIMMTEAWALHLPPQADISRELPRPCDHPDRVEVLTFQAEAKDGDNMCGEIIITRDDKGNPSLGVLKTWRSGVIHGRLTGLLMEPNN